MVSRHRDELVPLLRLLRAVLHPSWARAQSGRGLAQGAAVFCRRARGADVTLVTGGVSDEVYTQASPGFSGKEIAYLSSVIASINVRNRLGIAYRWTPPAR